MTCTREVIDATNVTLDGVVERPHEWRPVPLGGATEREEAHLNLHLSVTNRREK